MFAQKLYGLNAAKLESVCLVGKVLRHAADVDFALVDGYYQRNARLVGYIAPIVGVGDLHLLFFADGIEDDWQILAYVFVNARGRAHEQNASVQFLRVMGQSRLFLDRQILRDSLGQVFDEV